MNGNLRNTGILLLAGLFALSFLIYPLLPLKPIVAYSTVYIFTSLLFIIISLLIRWKHIQKPNFHALFVLSIILKIWLIFLHPTGSDDYYRYLWDGKVMAHHVNPYKYPPNDPALSSLHSKMLPSKVNFPNIKTIYPPLAEYIFYLAYLVGRESFIGLKIIIFLFDLLTTAGILLILARLKFNYENVLLYTLSPLVLFQYFVDSHVDAFGISLLVLAVLFYIEAKKTLSYIFLGLSICIKPTPLILIPVVFFTEKDILEKIKTVFIPSIVCILLYIPFIFSGSPFQALIQYAENWTFNGPVFDLLNFFIHNNQNSRVVCALLFTATYLAVLYSKRDFIERIYLSAFLLLIFSPVVHPWYLGWLAVILPIAPKLSGIFYVNLVSLTSFTVITYQLTGAWREYPLVLLAEYLPVISIFIYELTKKKLSSDLTLSGSPL